MKMPHERESAISLMCTRECVQRFAHVHQINNDDGIKSVVRYERG